MGALALYNMRAAASEPPTTSPHLRRLDVDAPSSKAASARSVDHHTPPTPSKGSGELACGVPVTGSNKGRPNFGGSPSGDVYYTFCVPRETTTVPPPSPDHARTHAHHLAAHT